MFNRHSLMVVGLASAVGVPYAVESPRAAWNDLVAHLTPAAVNSSAGGEQPLLTARLSESSGATASSGYPYNPSGSYSAPSSYSDAANSAAAAVDKAAQDASNAVSKYTSGASNYSAGTSGYSSGSSGTSGYGSGSSGSASGTSGYGAGAAGSTSGTSGYSSGSSGYSGGTSYSAGGTSGSSGSTSSYGGTSTSSYGAAQGAAASAGASSALTGNDKGPVDAAANRRPPVIPLPDALRFDLSTAAVVSRWPRVSAGLAELNLQGYRVPLVTGTGEDDIAGSLTYYFDTKQQIVHIIFRGTTGDPRKLVNYLTTKYEFARETTDDPSLQLYRIKRHGTVESELRIKQARVIRAESPRTRFEIELGMHRP